MRSLRVVVMLPLLAPDSLQGFVRVLLSGAMGPYILRLSRPLTTSSSGCFLVGDPTWVKVGSGRSVGKPRSYLCAMALPFPGTSHLAHFAAGLEFWNSLKLDQTRAGAGFSPCRLESEFNRPGI